MKTWDEILQDAKKKYNKGYVVLEFSTYLIDNYRGKSGCVCNWVTSLFKHCSIPYFIKVSWLPLQINNICINNRFFRTKENLDMSTYNKFNDVVEKNKKSEIAKEYKVSTPTIFNYLKQRKQSV